MTEYTSVGSRDYINPAVWESTTSSRLSSMPAVPLYNRFRIGERVRMKKDAELRRPYPDYFVGKILTIKGVNYSSESRTPSYFFEGYDDRTYIYEEDLEPVRACRLNRRGN